jgi:hypothetical protein
VAIRRPAAGGIVIDANQPAAPFTLELWGVAARVVCEEPEFAARLAQALPPGSVGPARADVRRTYVIEESSSVDGRVFALRVGDSVVARRRTLEALARVLGARFRQFAAVRTDRWVVLHAGVVSHEGHAIVLPGRSHAGKSTLVAALVRAGARYCSDEYAVLDDDGLVHPFAKPLSLRPHDGGLARLVDAAQLGPVEVSPVAIGSVFALEYSPDAAWGPVAMTRGEATMCLIDNAVAARNRFTLVRRTVSAALGLAPRAWRGRRGEADDAACEILALALEWG